MSNFHSPSFVCSPGVRQPRHSARPAQVGVHAEERERAERADWLVLGGDGGVEQRGAIALPALRLGPHASAQDDS